MTTLKDLIEGADLDLFMDSESGFAIEATFNGTFGPYTIKGIFDKGEPVFNDHSGQVEVETSVLLVREKDFLQVKNHDTVTIENVIYKVETFDHDGTGLTTLALYKDREN